ncbi:Rieske (2Fe-2S) protein [Sphingobium xenophagum]|uniref:Rieske (2Fe-2S) protein n=1 Tax=Sphingobium xenophagum TaxID=121428 RepID=UPI00037DE62A|nr:Rieske 2Fe-2S domain-containing protein [Sphingobium xenophagum]
MSDGYWRRRPFAPVPSTRLIGIDELVPPAARAFTFGAGPNAFRMFIVRSISGELRGYLNLCPHASLTLDRDSGEFLTPDRDAIFCRQHCAIFSMLDGRCFSGACEGEYLHPIELALIDGWVCIGSRPNDPPESGGAAI